MRTTLFALLVFLLLPFVSAQEYGWQVDSFRSEVELRADTSVRVEENIAVDFYDVERRGILRDIPVRYQNTDDKWFDINLRIQEVTDAAGRPWEWTSYRSGVFETIRVGNPDVYLTGKQEYSISYEAERTYLLQERGDEELIEYAWNVNGSWPVDIERLEASFMLPDGAEVMDVHRVICFIGVYGTSYQDCSYRTSERGGRVVVEVWGNGPVEYYEQLTVGLELSRDLFTLPPWHVQLGWWLAMYWMRLVPLFFIALIVYLWIRFGKDPARGTSVPDWNPPGDLSPSLMGTLYDDFSSTEELASTLIYFATRGFIKISKLEGKKEYEFTKLKEADDTLNDGEKYLLDKLFGSKKTKTTKDLKKKFYKHLPTIYSKWYKAMASLKLYHKNPDDVRGTYFGLAWVILVVGIIFAGVHEDGMTALFVIIAFVLWLVFAFVMPKRTVKGMELLTKVYGLREFIARAEKYRLEFVNAPGKTVEEFERLLPFAMVLGVEKEWAKEFQDIYKKEPDWFRGTEDFNTTSFVNSLRDMSKSTTTAMRSTPPSSSGGSTGWSTSSSYSSSGGSSFSGGFSGGGFGGGGGGSW